MPNQAAQKKRGIMEPHAKCKYDEQEVLEKIREVAFWGQSIPLPYGIVTPGRVMNNVQTIRKIQLTDNLKGKRVLDIGAWDGYYSFECERRGAQVLAIDNLNRMKRPDETQFNNLGNAGFETAKDILDSKVEFRNMDVYDIDEKAVGKYDIVVFLGVLYHLKHPCLALEKISEVTNDQLIIETEWILTPLARRPLLEYIQGDSLNQDPTNFCRPNTAWIKSVLKDCGFAKVVVLDRSLSWLKSLSRATMDRSFVMNGRIVVKAWK
jgi:tRNA (mo5U34)-methyltransferase